MRALVIDDSRFIRDFVHSILVKFDVVCVEAGNGQEALTRLGDSGPFAFALIDWNMPVMSGIDMLKAARENQAYNETRFVMMTTEAEADHMEMALNAGADEYLVKPFDAEGLVDKLRLAGVEGI